MAPIGTEKTEAVCIITLARGVTNPIDLALVTALSNELDSIENDSTIRSVVLTGNSKFFSIGFDIPALIELDRQGMGLFFGAMDRLSLRLYAFPKPTVIAMTGHAIAGGCILAICGDYRYISEGRKLMGLNEIKLGLPVPYPADRILDQVVGARHAREIMESGDFYESEQSMKMGLVDKMLPGEQVLPAAVEKARTLGRMPTEAFRRIKGNRVEPTRDLILAALDERKEAFLDFWFSKGTQALLRDAAKNF
ncbi:MAG: enoyl-CoA hydratase/isomerase family protein [Deltaproteobacteria bacterium]|nr:enoyl-CoA hydratase/isomerase family protein [Deltaproteobacteria bacterium]